MAVLLLVAKSHTESSLPQLDVHTDIQGNPNHGSYAAAAPFVSKGPLLTLTISGRPQILTRQEISQLSFPQFAAMYTVSLTLNLCTPGTAGTAAAILTTKDKAFLAAAVRLKNLMSMGNVSSCTCVLQCHRPCCSCLAGASFGCTARHCQLKCAYAWAVFRGPAVTSLCMTKHNVLRPPRTCLVPNLPLRALLSPKKCQDPFSVRVCVLQHPVCIEPASATGCKAPAAITGACSLRPAPYDTQFTIGPLLEKLGHHAGVQPCNESMPSRNDSSWHYSNTGAHGSAGC